MKKNPHLGEKFIAGLNEVGLTIVSIDVLTQVTERLAAMERTQVIQNNLVRPTWDEYFAEIAVVTSRRSSCAKRHVGAVLVKDHHIISTGYNGAPAGMPHCTHTCTCSDHPLPGSTDLRLNPRCPIHGDDGETCPLSIHAEVNAVVAAQRDVRDATLYVTSKPCPRCVLVLYAAGVTDWRYPSIVL